MCKKKVVLGYSGGVDSTAAVKILQEQGFEVIALTLDMCGDSELVSKARKSAADAKISFEAFNCEELFQTEIKDYFTSEYLAGRTPAPCTRCNPRIKWLLLLEYANRNKIDRIATGHYFKITEHNGKLYVTRADDKRKDQSYYLWGLSQEVLARAVTPMSNIIKEQINTAKRKESMGVCFLGTQRYSDYIRGVCGEVPRGDIVDKSGQKVGEHEGLPYYTVGQKRGYGIPAGSLIIALDKAHNSLVVGQDQDLYHSTIVINDCNIVDEVELLESNDITVMVRGIGRNPEGYLSSVEKLEYGYQLNLSTPAWACAAGQPVVLYRGDRVIGGGYLERSY